VQRYAFDKGYIFLRSSKNGEPRFIPLIGYASSLIELQVSKINSLECLIFASPNDPQKPYDIRTAWRAALTRANIDGTT
jgi:hypothetical protein